MPDIKVKYSGDGENKTVVIDLDENVVGLNLFSTLNDFINTEMKNGIKMFTFDMTGLKSINSSGLGILISCLKKIKDSNGSLKIINANEKIVNIFKLTKLNNVFELESSS